MSGKVPAVPCHSGSASCEFVDTKDMARERVGTPPASRLSAPDPTIEDAIVGCTQIRQEIRAGFRQNGFFADFYF